MKRLEQYVDDIKEGRDPEPPELGVKFEITKLTRARAWAEKNPDLWERHRRASHLKCRYGITIKEYDSILNSQGGVCAICESGVSDVDRRFHVDHCHKSGVVRGILCGRCNRAIGQFGDDPDLCDRAAEYLRRGTVHGHESD